MSLDRKFRTVLLAHEQEHLTIDEAVEMLMQHLVERYIPKYKLGGCKHMISVEYNHMDITAAHTANVNHGIYFHCEDGRVCYVDTEGMGGHYGKGRSKRPDKKHMGAF